MLMAVQERQAISARHLFTVLITAGVILFAAHCARAQVSCEDCGQCMTNCVCQSDGTCKGTPLPTTQGCDDHNDCTTGDHCDGAGNCTHTGTKQGACTLPGSSLCTGTCEVFAGIAVCLPDCQDECHFCDPNTGQCTLNLCSSNPCSTGQCDADGLCIPGHEGETCDDGNVCTTTSQCQDGECVGTGGTPGPTSTPTATPPSVSGCVGDCNNDGVVAIDEIITGIDIALGNLEVSDCENFDANEDDLVTVDELLTGVDNALNGCPTPESTPTPTHAAPTSTPSPAPPTNTPTQTPTHAPVTSSPTTSPGAGTPSIGTRATGTVESTTSAFLVIPDLLSALLGHLPGAGSGSGASTITIPFTCNSGGGQVDCTQPGFYTGKPTFKVTLNSCQVTGSTGTLTFNGTLSATGQDSDNCVSIPTNVALSIPSLTVQTPTGTATFTNFSAGVSLSCSAGSCSCRYDTASLVQLAGTIAVAGTNTNSQITFGADSSISISVTSYSGKCVPTVYDMEVNGPITLTTNGNTFAATYDAYTIHDNAGSGHDMVEISGDVTSACFGDTVTFSTSTDIALGNPCPSAGVVRAQAQASGNTHVLHIVTYSSSGVDVDGTHFDSCLSQQLFVCPAS